MRETANLWFWLFKKKRLPLRIIKSRFFIQDTILTHWHRFWGCNHKTKLLIGDNMTEYDFCFKCYRQIGETRKVYVAGKVE